MPTSSICGSAYRDSQLEIWRRAGVEPTMVPIDGDADSVLARALELLGF
jgi:hypothetical protein